MRDTTRVDESVLTNDSRRVSPSGYLHVISHICTRDWLLIDTKLIVDNYGQLKSLQVICGRQTEDNVCYGNKFTGRRRSCKGASLIEYEIIEKLIRNI